MSRTVAEKLQMKPGDAVFIVGADEAGRTALGALPDGAHVVDATKDAAVAVLFADDRAGLEALLAVHLDALADARARWIVYPKGNRADINRDSIWRLVEEHGWSLVSNVAVDEVRSAVRMKPTA